MSDVTEFLTQYSGDNEFLIDLADKIDRGRMLTQRQRTALVERSREYADWIEDRDEHERQAAPILSIEEQMAHMRAERQRTAHRLSRLSKERREAIVARHKGQQPVHVLGIGSLRIAADGSVTPR